jgi:hypothetical protein
MTFFENPGFFSKKSRSFPRNPGFCGRSVHNRSQKKGGLIMTKRHLLGFAAVTALILMAATPSFARGGGHAGGHGGHGGHRGGHAAAHVARGGHAHSFAHAGGHAHHNASVAHAAGRHVGANHSFAHGYAHGSAGGNHYGWNHGGWNHYGWNRGYGYAGLGWGRGWGYGYPGYWGRRYGLWNVGYWGGVGPGYLPYTYGVSDPSYYYQYYNNVTVPMTYPSITKLTQVDGANAIEPGALTVPPAPADPLVQVSDSSVLDSTIAAQASSDSTSTR